MTDESWYPGKNMWDWTKKTVKDHPRIAGAVAAVGVTAAVVGTGGVAIPILLGAGVAGQALGGAVAADAKDKEEKK